MPREAPACLSRPDGVAGELHYFREGRSEKHLKDIASILAVSPDQIDFDQLQEKINAYGLEKEWTEAKSILKKE